MKERTEFSAADDIFVGYLAFYIRRRLVVFRGTGICIFTGILTSVLLLSSCCVSCLTAILRSLSVVNTEFSGIWLTMNFSLNITKVECIKGCRSREVP